MGHWYKEKPEIFKKRVHDQADLNTFRNPNDHPALYQGQPGGHFDEYKAFGRS